MRENGNRMHIVRLTREQVIGLYPRLEEAFPGDELKPLNRILAGVDRGNYDCLGLTENDRILGYAYFVRTGKHLLFDYFSIFPEYRSRGYGAAFLRLLGDYFMQADSVIAEVEDPERSPDEESRALRERRLRFYLRNGFVNTGVRVYVFDVHYLLLNYGGNGLPAEDIRALYREHYRRMLPTDMFERFVKV